MKREEGKRGKTRRRGEEVREGKKGERLQESGNGGRGREASSSLFGALQGQQGRGKTERREEAAWDTSDDTQSEEPQSGEEGGVDVHVCLEVNICSFRFECVCSSSRANQPKRKTLYAGSRLKEK